MKIQISTIIAVVILSACAQTKPVEPGSYSLTSDTLSLGDVTFPHGKKRSFDIGYGSGAFHDASDPDNIFYTVTDRGPNIKCRDTLKVTGIPSDALCHGDTAGKVFPLPAFSPTIYKIALNPDRSISVLEAINLKTSAGQPITGLSNPLLTSNTEKAFDQNGTQLAFDANGLDVEALVRLTDGTFWLSDEYAPSLVHVAADGRVLERWVPHGLADDLAAARYPVSGKLPGILKRRKLNRGIESVAVSPDQHSLYFAMQSPLANPDVKAYKKSNAVRLFKIALPGGEIAGEYIYPLDDPASFIADNAGKKRKQNSVKVSEMAALGNDRLLVLERVSRTTKFYVVDLKTGRNLSGSKWDAEVVSPSLEQLGVRGLAKKGMPALAKTLVLNTDDIIGMPTKIEGIGVINTQTLMLVNDNDFGIDGAKTRVVVTRLAKPLY